MNNTKIALLGGDMRMPAAAEAFAESGCEAAVWGFDGANVQETDGVTYCRSVCEALVSADAVVLPLPVSGDGVRLFCPNSERELKLSELFALLSPDVPVFGGSVSDKVRAAAEQNGISITDCLESDELCILNAVPTAEGAVAIAISEMKRTLRSSKAVVLGCGRVARALCGALTALGADVTACARKPADYAWMQTVGVRPADITRLEDIPTDTLRITSGAAALAEADVVFNTVPVVLLGRAALERLPKSAVVIDLASNGGGIDLEAARSLGINTVRAMSLPGRVAPVSAGRALAQYIRDMVESVQAR